MRSRHCLLRNSPSFAAGFLTLTGRLGIVNWSATSRRESSMPLPTKHCGSTRQAKPNRFETPRLTCVLVPVSLTPARYSTHRRPGVRTPQARPAASFLSFSRRWGISGQHASDYTIARSRSSLVKTSSGSGLAHTRSTTRSSANHQWSGRGLPFVQRRSRCENSLASSEAVPLLEAWPHRSSRVLVAAKEGA